MLFIYPQSVHTDVQIFAMVLKLRKVFPYRPGAFKDPLHGPGRRNHVQATHTAGVTRGAQLTPNNGSQ